MMAARPKCVSSFQHGIARDDSIIRYWGNNGTKYRMELGRRYTIGEVIDSREVNGELQQIVCIGCDRTGIVDAVLVIGAWNATN